MFGKQQLSTRMARFVSSLSPLYTLKKHEFISAWKLKAWLVLGQFWNIGLDTYKMDWDTSPGYFVIIHCMPFFTMLERFSLSISHTELPRDTKERVKHILSWAGALFCRNPSKTKHFRKLNVLAEWCRLTSLHVVQNQAVLETLKGVSNVLDSVP